jgi:hypothetical protein
MAKRGIKKKEHERLDDATVSRVVSLLEQENPITKKAACEILNISYNTARLAKIIGEYKGRIEFTKKRLEANKGQPFSDLEIKELVTDYLNGISISNIADNLYRSVYSVKKKIAELNLPERTKNATYQNPDLIPDEAVAKDFEKGELVWSARYGAVAEIHEKIGTYFSDEPTYRIWVFGKHNEFAYQPWWELGKLEAIKRFELTADKFMRHEKPNFAYRII